MVLLPSDRMVADARRQNLVGMNAPFSRASRYLVWTKSTQGYKATGQPFWQHESIVRGHREASSEVIGKF